MNLSFKEAVEALKGGKIIKTECNRRLFIRMEGDQPVDALRSHVFFTQEDEFATNWQVLDNNKCLNFSKE